MKRLLLSIFILSIFISVKAQYPTVSIADIQNVDQADLQAGNDVSSLLGDTVVVQGVVTFDLWNSCISGRRSFC